MQAYKLETKLLKSGVLTLKGLPFHSGDKVEVIIFKCNKTAYYPLKGKVIKYDNPFESVAQNDWEITK